MNLARLLIASIATQGVYKRFAQLSDEDKAKVVEKVKERVKGKGEAEPETEESPAKPEKKEEVVEEVTEEAPADAEEEAPAEPEESPKSEIEDIVGDLIEEVEVIKTDGHVSPSEVLGLIDNMVRMVQTLLQAKPGRAKKASREEAIAERLVRSRMAARPVDE